MYIYFTFILEGFFHWIENSWLKLFFLFFFFPRCYCIIFLWLLSRFYPFHLWFSLYYVLSCLGFIEILESVNLGFISNLKNFQPLFHQIFFYPILSLFFWDCSYSRDRLCPQGMRFCSVFVFSNLFFPLSSSDWIISIGLSWSSLILSNIISIMLNSASDFFASFIYCIFLVLEFPVGSL